MDKETVPPVGTGTPNIPSQEDTEKLVQRASAFNRENPAITQQTNLGKRKTNTQSEQRENNLATSTGQKSTNQNTTPGAGSNNSLGATQHKASDASTNTTADIGIANDADSQRIDKSEMKTATTSISGDQNPDNEQPLVGNRGLENQSIQSTDKKYDNPTSFQAEAGGMTATFTTQENANKFREIFKDSPLNIKKTLENFVSINQKYEILCAANICNTFSRAKGIICGNTGALKEPTNSDLNLKYEDVQAPDEAKLKAAEFLQEVEDWGNFTQTLSEREKQLGKKFNQAVNRSGILRKSFFQKLWEKILNLIKWESPEETTKKDIEKLKQEIKSTLKNDFQLDENTSSELVDSEFKQNNPATINCQNKNDVLGSIIVKVVQQAIETDPPMTENKLIKRVLDLASKPEYNIICSGNVLSSYQVNDPTTPFATLNSNLGHIINAFIFGNGPNFSEKKAHTAWSDIEKTFGLDSVNKAAHLMLLVADSETKRQQIRRFYQNYYETHHKNVQIPELYVWGSEVDKWWSEYNEIKEKEENLNKDESEFSAKDQQGIKELNTKFENFKKEHTTPLKEDGANENGPYRVLDLGNFKVMATEEQIQNLTLDQFNQII